MTVTPDKFLIKVLTPVHIGCDEVYEPMSFVVDAEHDRMILFDPLDFIISLEEADRKRISEICRQGTVGSILELYKFLRGRPAQGRDVALCSGFVQHYGQALEIPLSDEARIGRELNEFSIARTAFLSYDQRPYLPGSGIKGAMRTAYLNALATGANIRIDVRRPGADRELEERLLQLDRGFRGIVQDPFRLLKISDFVPVGEVKTRIVYAVNEKKVPSSFEPSGPYQVLEVVEPGAEFTGTIRLEMAERGSPIKSPLRIQPLLDSLHQFFRKQKALEDDQLRKIGVGLENRNAVNGSHLLRIGRHSGAECVTVEGYRNIRIMQPGTTNARWSASATTLWLAAESRKPMSKSGLQPFGWVALVPLKEDQERRMEEIERDRRAERELRERIRLDDLRQRIEAAQETAKRSAQEAEWQRIEERCIKAKKAQQQADLASMTKTEQAVALIQSADVTENEVVAIYQKIDEFETNEAVAAALKDYWIRAGKWKKKECSPKQLKKVAKVKEILGE
ncbi:MAG: type III-A CRISPR-associated RAMP protein Csm5 [Thermodesulfobacteriota bacterium]